VGNDAVTAGDWDTAVRHAEKALALDGSLPEAHKMLGLSHWRRGDTCRGKRHFLQFVALAPGDPMVPRVERILAAEEMRLCP
jgi:Flp pilus assembly protein TadD